MQERRIEPVDRGKVLADLSRLFVNVLREPRPGHAAAHDEPCLQRMLQPVEYVLNALALQRLLPLADDRARHEFAEVCVGRDMQVIVVGDDVEDVEVRPGKPDVGVVECERAQLGARVEDRGRRDVAVVGQRARPDPGVDLDTVVQQPLLLVRGQAVADDADTAPVVGRAQRHDERDDHLVPGLPVVVDRQGDVVATKRLTVVWCAHRCDLASRAMGAAGSARVFRREKRGI